MDAVTGVQVAITKRVPVPRERIWDLITAIERIGEFSPEAHDGAWYHADGPHRGARFVSHNRYGDGYVSTVTCVVTEYEWPATYAWAVLDDGGQVGSAWRYDLAEGDEPGTTLVRHEFTHGPGITGLREGAEKNPDALDRRLVALCRNMTATINAMVAHQTMIGATR